MTTSDTEALSRLGQAAEHVRAVVHLRPAWADPASLYDAVGLLDELTRTLHAAIGHGTRSCTRLASCTDLRADDPGEPANPAALAHSAALALDTAGQALQAANTEISAAHGHLSRLYLHTRTDDGKTA